jgi:hypothetical protein
VASAILRTDRLDLSEIMNNFSKSDKENDRSILFPDKLSMKLDFAVNELLMDRFQAKNVRGVAFYDSPKLRFDSLSMQTMGGTLKGDYGIAQDRSGDIFVSVHSKLYNLDIQNLFYSFNNFGQSYITDEHLKGSISGNCTFSSSFDSTFLIKKETILSENSIIIRNGELNNFSSLLALSRFIEVEELRNIQFETLENTILIKEGKVIIPSMDIHNSALNISASGIHEFNHHYDYRIRLKLSELLYNKARGSRNSEFIIAEDESDTRILFLKVFNEGSGTEVEMDREKTAEKIRDDLNQEKVELKKILNDELGLFKNDVSVTEESEFQKTGDESFKFEFSEEPDSARMDPLKEKGPGRRNRIKKDTSENKPAVEFVIDEQP